MDSAPAGDVEERDVDKELSREASREDEDEVKSDDSERERRERTTEQKLNEVENDYFFGTMDTVTKDFQIATTALATPTRQLKSNNRLVENLQNDYDSAAQHQQQVEEAYH